MAEDRITVLRKQAQSTLQFITLLTYCNIVSMAFNLFYIFYVLYLSAVYSLGNDISTIGRGNINDRNMSKSSATESFDYHIILLIINSINLCGLFSNFIGVLRSNSKFIVFYFYTNSAWIWLAVLYTIYLLSLAIPCSNSPNASFFACFKIGTITSILVIFNGTITCIMFLHFKKLVQVNKIIRVELNRILTEHYKTTDLNSIRLGTGNSIAAELKNELTAAVFVEHFKQLGNIEASVGSVRTIASDEPSPYPKPTVY